MVAVAFLLVGAVLGGGTHPAASHTYAANCGNTSFLTYKPRSWSTGCTGGSFNLRKVRWTSWGKRSARARGRSLERYECRRHGRPEWCTYRTRGRAHLYRPRTCHDADGRRHRFFTRSRQASYERRGNPFGARPGWHGYRETIAPDEGECTLQH